MSLKSPKTLKKIFRKYKYSEMTELQLLKMLIFPRALEKLQN